MIELTEKQQAIWDDLCTSIDIDPAWLLKTLNEYHQMVEKYGLNEMSDDLLDAKYEFGWVEHAVEFIGK